MLTLDSIPTSEVQHIEFLEREEELKHGWVIWIVRFWWNGVPWQGELQAGYPEPECFFADVIENCEYEDHALQESSNPIPYFNLIRKDRK